MKRDAETLHLVGTALYGPSWQTPLAKALDVSDRAVRYWAAGETIPEGVWGELAALCRTRAGDLAGWAQRLAAPLPAARRRP